MSSFSKNKKDNYFLNATRKNVVLDSLASIFLLNKRPHEFIVSLWNKELVEIKIFILELKKSINCTFDIFYVSILFNICNILQYMHKYMRLRVVKAYARPF